MFILRYFEPFFVSIWWYFGSVSCHLMSLCRYLEPFCILFLSHCKYFVSSWCFWSLFVGILCLFVSIFCISVVILCQRSNTRKWWSKPIISGLACQRLHAVFQTYYLPPTQAGRTCIKISWSRWSVLTPDMTTFSCYRWSFLLLHFFWNST